MIENYKILDLGCGNNKVPNSIGMDFNPAIQSDIHHDLNQFPYPFEDSIFDEIYIKDTLFLLNSPIKVMEEIYRIGKKNSQVIVVQPYFRSVWNHVDPLVKSYGTAHSFSFYDPEDSICKRYHYTSARFSTKKIIFDDHILNPNIIRKFIIYFANRYPRRYEIYISHLFPLDTITFHLNTLK
jgi:SAM-dependent methyltransferase